MAIDLEGDGKMSHEVDFLRHLVQARFAVGNERSGLRGAGIPLNRSGKDGFGEGDLGQVEGANGNEHTYILTELAEKAPETEIVDACADNPAEKWGDEGDPKDSGAIG